MTVREPWFAWFERTATKGARMHTGAVRCMCEDCWGERYSRVVLGEGAQ